MGGAGRRGEVGVGGGGGREPKREGDGREGQVRGVLGEDTWISFLVRAAGKGVNTSIIVIGSFINIIIILTPTFGPFWDCTIAFKLCQNVEFDDLMFVSRNSCTRTCKKFVCHRVLQAFFRSLIVSTVVQQTFLYRIFLHSLIIYKVPYDGQILPALKKKVSGFPVPSRDNYSR